MCHNSKKTSRILDKRLSLIMDKWSVMSHGRNTIPRRNITDACFEVVCTGTTGVSPVAWVANVLSTKRVAKLNDIRNIAGWRHEHESPPPALCAVMNMRITFIAFAAGRLGD